MNSELRCEFYPCPLGMNFKITTNVIDHITILPLFTFFSKLSPFFSTPFRAQRTQIMELKSAISSIFLHAGKHLNVSLNQRR